MKRSMLVCGAVTFAATVGCVSAAFGCEDFVVVSSENRSVEFIDNGEPGPSAGDLRLGYRELSDENGVEVGDYRWVVTMMPESESTSGEMFVEYIFVLEDGQILLSALFQTTVAAHDTDQIAVVEPRQAVITGGTGSYAHATGFALVTPGDGVVEFAFDINCGG